MSRMIADTAAELAQQAQVRRQADRDVDAPAVGAPADRLAGGRPVPRAARPGSAPRSRRPRPGRGSSRRLVPTISPARSPKRRSAPAFQVCTSPAGSRAHDRVARRGDDGRQLLGAPAREQQLPLVRAAARSRRRSCSRSAGAAVRVRPLDRIDQHRQRLAVAADEIERDLLHEPLHPQQRRVLVLVEDPAGDRQQVLEAASPTRARRVRSRSSRGRSG